MNIFRFLFVFSLSLGLLSAEEQRFSFALPEFEGRISLGVYDASGRLLRSLFVDAKEEEFSKGLNGLIATWDGQNEAGGLVPAGTYQVRGYVVGDAVQAEGLAYHFNDWIENDDSPRVSTVGAVVPEERETFLLTGKSRGEDPAMAQPLVLWRYEEESGLRELQTFPAEARFLAGDPDRVLIGDERSILYDLKQSEHPSRAPNLNFTPQWGALAGNRVFVGPTDSPPGEVQEWDSTTSSEGRVLPVPATFSGLDANAEGLLGWTPDGRVWVKQEGDFVAVPLQEKLEGLSVSAGPGASFWIAGKLGSEIVVRQHAFDGELWREMRVTEDFVDQIALFSDQVRPGFYLRLLSSDGKRQILRGYRPLEVAPLPVAEVPVAVDWEVFFDKTLVACPNFGWVDGRLVPDAGTAPQMSEVAFPLPPDTLNSRSSELIVDVASEDNGLWLRGEGGLPLLCLAERPDFKRVVLVRDAASLRVFAGDGVVVAEYVVTGLDQIAVIDAGTIEIP